MLRKHQLDPAPPFVFSGPFTPATLERFSESGRIRARQLESWAARAGADARVRSVLRVGEPYREIVAAAVDGHVDLIVLALHGHGWVHELLVGSVADRVIRMAPCPVLTVNAARSRR